MILKTSPLFCEVLCCKKLLCSFASLPTRTPCRNMNQHAHRKADEISLFLQQRDLKFKNSWTSFLCQNMFKPSKQPILNHLPKETVRNGNSKVNLNHCYINKTTGYFHCPESGHEGTWDVFRNYCRAQDKPRFAQSIEIRNSNLKNAFEMWENCRRLSDMKFEEVKALLSQFHLSGLDYNNLRKYSIRCTADCTNLVIPFFDVTKNDKQFTGFKVINNKHYAIDEECNVSTQAYTLYPQENFFGLFGLNEAINSGCPTVVLVANEFDAMAINASSNKYFSVALPVGVTGLTLGILPLLEHVSEIILWFGNNLFSLEALHIFAKKLGVQRCKLVRPQMKSSTAYIALKNGFNIDRIIDLAVPAVMKNVVSFSDLQKEVEDEIFNQKKYAGVPFKRFWNLNKLLKGHRRGELTIVTGPTGSGKTTFLSELSLDLATQGVSTLWGSFEINNKRLLVSMLKQFSRINLEANLNKFGEIAKEFNELPIKYMSYNGPENVDNVIKTMHHLVYTNDIQHIIIDNLQFMVGMQAKLDRFGYQDLVIDQFRQFATKWNVHVSLVVHPRKEEQNVPLQLSAVFGSAKATQEADNVLIVQQIKKLGEEKAPTIKYLEVAKNRYDGELGRVKLYFNRDTRCMSPSNPEQLSYSSTPSGLLKTQKSDETTEKVTTYSNVTDSVSSKQMEMPNSTPSVSLTKLNTVNTDQIASPKARNENSWINKFNDK